MVLRVKKDGHSKTALKHNVRSK
uniref:Uncharacterized protein n=1 Tax=Anguilla anguilla TaxID=7936 RepID=A0A0E9SCZ2_ANGAN